MTIIDLQRTRARLANLAALGDNWDGNGARAPRPMAVALVEEALHAYPSKLQKPALVPTTHGEIEMEWSAGTYYANAETSPAGWELWATGDEDPTEDPGAAGWLETWPALQRFRE